MTDFGKIVLVCFALAVAGITAIEVVKAGLADEEADGRDDFPVTLASTMVATVPLPIFNHPEFDSVILQCRVGLPK